MLRVLLPALLLSATMPVADAQPPRYPSGATVTQASETTTTTYVFTVPPAQQRCIDRVYEKTFHCQFQGCLRGCGDSAACRLQCVRSRRRCLSANGCEVMGWPFCAGRSFPPCAAASPSYPAQDTCVPLRLVNRTRHVIETTAVDGADLGVSLAPGSKADAYVSPSRSGATIVAVASSTPAGRRCEWRVALRGCLEPGVRRRVVFRQSAASCAP